ncbi:MAG: FGGY family carbohydrate kinase [Thermoproteota archaeon]
MKKDLVLVLDCGSTNIRAIAVDEKGELLASSSKANRTIEQPGGKPGWKIWDLDEIWQKIAEASREVTRNVGTERIKAVTITTWGADGAPVRRDGALTYPPISWQCQRTSSMVKEITKRISFWEIYKITGYQVISFNTLLKLMWLRQNVPSSLERAHTWLMMPGLLAYKLTGEFHIEPTSASTTMAMDLGRRDWSKKLLELADLDPTFFPKWSEPGDFIGEVKADSGRVCNLKRGTPVIASGHDTQFALIGSGAELGEVVLSSGTWEILEMRVSNFRPNRIGFDGGMIIEADAEKGLWNPQLLMMGSAVLEWIRERFYTDLDSRDYGTMIDEASNLQAGSGELMLVPSFVPDSGPMRRYRTMGTILGLSLHTSRAQVYRAALEGLSYQLRYALHILEASMGFKAKGVCVVGGGSRNDLWNRIRADVTGLPVTVMTQREATVIGAALTAFTGIGVYSSLKEASKAVKLRQRRFMPGKDREKYEKLFQRFKELPRRLIGFY